MLPYAALCHLVPLQVFESRQYPDSAQRLAAGAAGGCVLSAHVSAVSHCAGNHAADAAIQVSPLCNLEWYGCGYKRNAQLIFFGRDVSNRLMHIKYAQRAFATVGRVAENVAAPASQHAFFPAKEAHMLASLAPKNKHPVLWVMHVGMLLLLTPLLLLYMLCLQVAVPCHASLASQHARLSRCTRALPAGGAVQDV